MVNGSSRPYLKGAISGVFAALVLIASSLIVRAEFGIGTIAELASDRIAPLTGIPLFFKLLNLLSGYSHLKQLGIVATLLLELAGGAIVGLLYTRLQRSERRPRAMAVTSAVVAGILLLTLVGLWPNLLTNYDGLPPLTARPASILGLFVETALFLAALFWAGSLLRRREQPEVERDERRRALTFGVASAVTAAVSIGILGYFYKIASYHYDGTENVGDDLEPVTSNDDFYQVTKNNVDPRPTLDKWALEVGGDVAHPAVLRMSDLQALPSVLQETTLQCISNEVGGGLNSNAKWKGVLLRDVIQRSGPSEGARQVMFHGADGFSDEIPFEKAMHPQTLLAFEMNEETLPQRHGFPVRLIVPGYVGEKSVKWLTRIDVRKVPGKGFYEQQGWGPQFTINTSSRFDSTFDDSLHVGQRVVLKGTAFAGDRGVKKVEVSTDDGNSWNPAEITYQGSDLAWVQWRFPWQPSSAGEAMLSVRCVDGLGKVQVADASGPAPNPATGLHHLKVTVVA